MAKTLSQITFDFAANLEEIKPDTENLQSTSIKEGNYTVPKPPENKGAESNDAEIIRVKEISFSFTQKSVEPIVKSSTRGRRSLKNSGFDEEKINIPVDEILFQKQYYAIGEVAIMFNVNGSLLRYWETEFDILQPRKNKKGDRFFRPQDIKNLFLIFDLLRRRKFTIEGAKDYLKSNKKVEEQYELIQSLEKIKSFLLELKTQL